MIQTNSRPIRKIFFAIKKQRLDGPLSGIVVDSRVIVGTPDFDDSRRGFFSLFAVLPASLLPLQFPDGAGTPASCVLSGLEFG